MRHEKIHAAPSVSTGKRRHSRLRVGLPAQMQSAAATTECELLDLSETGARFSTPEPPKAGAMVMVHCFHLELFGTVMWRRRGVVGMAFDEPLPLDQVVSVRGLADETARMEQEAARQAAKAWARGYGS